MMIFKNMLYQLLRDMWDILRLRYRSPTEYLYTLPVLSAVLLLIGLVNAAGMSQLFGKSTAAIIFSVLLSIFKWLLLSRAMSGVLHYYGSPKLPFLGFVLATEALVIPALLVFYVPALGSIGIFWQVWTFWVQAIGFMKMGQQSAWKVLLGYIVYLVALMFFGSLLILLFTQMGWMDLQSINEQANAIWGASTKTL
ncbi:MULTISPECIES: hypothetical protein [unclassified Neisseria]|uniref:hypothetical protein n=1 Tax=unclassified Neisseria TaxID=2623750 RepID=UPI002666F908|nr:MULTISPECIES: hypothetical protein [unclassified Neisseria]MDO1509392.1 hypothetical protein [Neisseria sp. MVDL19-042950]MDO1515835.1 hypothetical protein [Neisseria sp. MVDL18-041461]MDO1563341.1 hypothetical protein [Neisseria sp. MVDL20-010259]